MLQTIDRPASLRRTPPGSGGTTPRRPQPPLSPAPVRHPVPCREEDPELWFAESPTDLELAKTLCAQCPVRDACLAGALDRAEPWGVWGGEIFDRGVVIARKRPRGRPRKVTAA
ncbi:WhiB family transcriptional regulator, redox-sensing transcriptional regulator [Blastococcus aggregatus]|uniref:Transcriptional regulator WhiB n=1 Tax=Blastococcus aggregatus TaxID=38502 RepID=A0A285V410_9ACTN|nr:WhiB family transcriptional regulator [Blastococcus aggregatus]SOC48842.1 WhiB family transcriptional regulator, redox-sensing transcriptional regulator [Blastococcus aggregatus]